MGVELSQIAEHTRGVTRVVGDDVLITDITHDSRRVTPGSLFVAIRGEVFDGHDFIEPAVDAGASALLLESECDLSVPQIVVENSRMAVPWAASSVFGFPDTSLEIAGVTGTNGKTTVVYMLEAIMESVGRSVGVIGTLGARINGVPLSKGLTTPEATELQGLLAEMRDGGVDVVLMEVSSHAIEMHRCDAIRYSVVGFTNLSQDHLDFHGGMEEYFKAKEKLFNKGVAETGVVNVDDPWGLRLRQTSQISTTALSFSSDSDISASDIVAGPTGVSFTAKVPEGSTTVSLPLVGEFNVSNALVAIGMARNLGVGIRDIARGLEGLDPVPGRMEMIRHDGPFTVIVDFAHTPDAIEVVLESVKPTVAGRLITIVGAGGDRDKTKRVLMGSVASRHSDLTIVTTDNPRSEDPVVIAAEVEVGAVSIEGARVEVVVDRRSAIRRGVSLAEGGDMIMVLGRGHEHGQEIASGTIPFDDRGEARSALISEGWSPS